MDPVAFTFFGHDIRWYGIMAALGFSVGYAVLYRRRAYAGLSEEQVSSLLFLAMIAGIGGARVFYVWQNWDYFRTHSFLKMLAIQEGGLVFYGGFIFAFIALCLYCRLKSLSILAILDSFAPTLALAHVFGRLGCFLNGCCFGKPCDGAIGYVYPERTQPFAQYGSQALHPVQLYEAFGNFVLFLVLYQLLGRLRKGQVAATYLMGYGVIRFCDEWFRGDYAYREMLWGLTPAQRIDLFVLLPLGLILFWICRRQATLTPLKQAPPSVE